MELLFAILVGCLGGVVGWRFFGFNKKCADGAIRTDSTKVALVLACFMLGAIFGMGGYSKFNQPPAPQSLQEAGLREKSEWDDGDYRLASKILVAQIEKQLPALQDAGERGDAALALERVLALNDAAGQWPSSYGNEAVSKAWRPCHLALVYLLGYASEGHGLGFVKSNLAACKKLI